MGRRQRAVEATVDSIAVCRPSASVRSLRHLQAGTYLPRRRQRRCLDSSLRRRRGGGSIGRADGAAAAAEATQKKTIRSLRTCSKRKETRESRAAEAVEKCAIPQRENSYYSLCELLCIARRRKHVYIADSDRAGKCSSCFMGEDIIFFRSPTKCGAGWLAQSGHYKRTKGCRRHFCLCESYALECMAGVRTGIE